ncbi:hypothetical protein DFH29DRAFT_879986 [Suillus ampliporus]|nr:hypothetical protein DFH29DRAFT_879986 [Suillus ampliporus]
MRAELFQEAVARSWVLSVILVDHDTWHMHEHSELVKPFSLYNMNERIPGLQLFQILVPMGWGVLLQSLRTVVGVPLGIQCVLRYHVHCWDMVWRHTNWPEDEIFYKYRALGLPRSPSAHPPFPPLLTIYPSRLSADMTQQMADQFGATIYSPPPGYVDSSSVVPGNDFIHEQFGGGRRHLSLLPEITPTRLRTNIKATSWDVGIAREANIHRQAHPIPSPKPVQSASPLTSHADGHGVTSPLLSLARWQWCKQQLIIAPTSASKQPSDLSLFCWSCEQ